MHAPLPLLSHICTQTTPHPPAPLGLWPPPLRPNLPSEPQLDQDYGKDFSLSGRAHLLPQWKTEGKQRPGTRNSYLLSFICVYRGWGSGSWSLTSKLAPGSWKGHGHHQGQPEHTGRTGPSLNSPRQGWLPPSPTSSHNCLPSPGGSSRCHRPEWRPRCHAPCSPGPRPPSRSGPAG